MVPALLNIHCLRDLSPFNHPWLLISFTSANSAIKRSGSDVSVYTSGHGQAPNKAPRSARPYVPTSMPSRRRVSSFRSMKAITFLPFFQAKHTQVKSNDEEGEVLCDTLFSLAYGALLLLSHTTLRLIRGRRYGILGTNGSGKSTLMRQLRDSKVENFPPQDQLRAVMVEHSLQGEDGSLSVLDFIAAGKRRVAAHIVRFSSVTFLRSRSRRREPLKNSGPTCRGRLR